MLLATFTWDPVIPWSLPVIGWPLFLACASVLILLTVGSYLFHGRMTKRRLTVLLAFRLLALVLVFLTLLRPAYATREVDNPPSTLVIAIDDSLSMNNRDEFDRKSRWQYALQMLKESKPSLQRLREERNTTVELFRFAGDVRDFDPVDLDREPGEVKGKRTDFGQMMEKLLQRYSAAGPLRGLIIISDGTDNGPDDPRKLAKDSWRKLCKVYTVGCGDPQSGGRDRDIALTKITVDPSEVPVKNELAVTGVIDSYGYKGSQVLVQLLVDGKPVDSVKVVLSADPKKPSSNETRNQVTLKGTAPDKPGDMKVTMKVSNMPDEFTWDNNELTTYVPVTREGISILLIDRTRFPEPQEIIRALENDKRKRFRIYRYWLSDGKPEAAGGDYFEFGKQHYDAVFIGDVSASQVKARDPQFFARLKEQVETKRTGLIWAPGQYGFNDVEWRDKAYAELLPVDPSNTSRVRGASFRLEPTPEGWDRTIMRLAETPEQSREVWDKLRELEEATRLKLKDGAFILGQHSTGPLFAGYDPGKGTHGRALVLGVDTTSRWRIDDPGKEAHRRFWHQIMLWLTHQDEAEGEVWVEAPQRRLLTGQPFRFEAGLRDRTGAKIPLSKINGASFSAEVVTPAGQRKIDLKDIEMGTSGVVTTTDDSGEYRIEVKGAGQGPDGRPIPEKPDAPPAVVRFVVMPNTAETTDKAARPEFLRELANVGGGEFCAIKDLPRLLKKLEDQPLRGERTKVDVTPNWKSRHPSLLEPLILVLFVGLVAMEWLCRRKWGMV